MNKCMIIGNLGKDVELRHIAMNGKDVAEFPVAVKRFGSQDKTDWFNVVVWGKMAENCSKYLNKGSKVAVVGSMQFETFDKQDGTKGYSSKLIAQDVEFLDSKKQDGYTELKGDDTPF